MESTSVEEILRRIHPYPSREGILLTQHHLVTKKNNKKIPGLRAEPFSNRLIINLMNRIIIDLIILLLTLLHSLSLYKVLIVLIKRKAIMKQYPLPIRSPRIILTSLFVILCVLINAQTNENTNFPQLLYPGFSSGMIKMKNGKSQTSEMNYDMVTGSMVMEKDGQYFDLLNTGTIDTVYLHNSRFIPYGKAFYEVIYAAPITLFLHHKGYTVHAGKPGAYGTTSQTSSTVTMSSISTKSGYYKLELPPDILVKVELVYWVNKDNNMSSFKNLKQFLKIFPAKNAELKEYIKSNNIKIDSRDDLIKLMSYCNDIIAEE
jgi:hypothetical protein